MTTQTLDSLRTAFHLPREQAAVALGLTVNELKKALKQLNIARWPYRKLASLQSLHQDLEHQLQQFASTGGDDPAIANHIRDLQEMQSRIAEDSAKIMLDPNTPLDESLHKLRLQNYKARFLGRHGHLTSPPMLRLPPQTANTNTTSGSAATAGGDGGAGTATSPVSGSSPGPMDMRADGEEGTEGSQGVGRRRRAASIVASTHIKRAAGLVGGDSDEEDAPVAQAANKARAGGKPARSGNQRNQVPRVISPYHGAATMATLPSLPEGAAFYDTGMGGVSRLAQSAPLYDEALMPGAPGQQIQRSSSVTLSVLNDSVAAISLHHAAGGFRTDAQFHPGQPGFATLPGAGADGAPQYTFLPTSSGSAGSAGSTQFHSRKQGVPAHLLPPRPGTQHPPSGWPHPGAPSVLYAPYNSAPVHYAPQPGDYRSHYSESSSTTVTTQLALPAPHPHAASMPALPGMPHTAQPPPAGFGSSHTSYHAPSSAPFPPSSAVAPTPGSYASSSVPFGAMPPAANFHSQQLQQQVDPARPWPAKRSNIPVAEQLVTPLEELLDDMMSEYDQPSSDNMDTQQAPPAGQPPSALFASLAPEPSRSAPGNSAPLGVRAPAGGASSRRLPSASAYFLLNNGNQEEEDPVLRALLAAPEGETAHSRLLGGTAHTPSAAAVDAARWQRVQQQQRQQQDQPAPAPAGQQPYSQAPQQAWSNAQTGSASCPALPSGNGFAFNTITSGDRGAADASGSPNLQTISSSPRPGASSQDTGAPSFTASADQHSTWSMHQPPLPVPVFGANRAAQEQASRLVEENARLQAQLAEQQAQLAKLQAQLAGQQAPAAAAPQEPPAQEAQQEAEGAGLRPLSMGEANGEAVKAEPAQEQGGGGQRTGPHVDTDLLELENMFSQGL